MTSFRPEAFRVSAITGDELLAALAPDALFKAVAAEPAATEAETATDTEATSAPP